MVNKVESSLEDQNKLVEFVLSKIKNHKRIVEQVKTNRPEPQLRLRFFADESDDEIDILSSIIFKNRKKMFERSPSNVSMSNEYKTEILTLLEDIQISENDKLPAKTQIYFISADPNRKASSFGKNSSQLKPSKFMFKGKTISEKDLSRQTKNAFENIKSVSNIKPEIKQFCIDLLDQIENSPPRNNNGVKIKSELGKEIEPQDINTIAKNFGEILGALWYMKIDPEEDEVEYPSKDNERIVDYTIHTNRNGSAYLQPVSAKSKQGAPSALSGLLVGQKNRIKNIKNRPNSIDFIYNNFLEELCSLNLEESIIYANRNFMSSETEAYGKLRRKITSLSKYEQPSATVRKIENYITKKYANKIDKKNPESVDKITNEFIQDFSDIFESCSFSPDFQKVKRAMLSNSKIELLLYPLGRAAVYEMNSDENGLLDYFNFIMRKSGIAQVTINLTSDSIKFNLYNDPRMESSRGTYYFEYNSSYEKPKNKGFSFKLKPGK